MSLAKRLDYDEELNLPSNVIKFLQGQGFDPLERPQDFNTQEPFFFVPPRHIISKINTRGVSFLYFPQDLGEFTVTDENSIRLGIQSPGYSLRMKLRETKGNTSFESLERKEIDTHRYFLSYSGVLQPQCTKSYKFIDLVLNQSS